MSCLNSLYNHHMHKKDDKKTDTRTRYYNNHIVYIKTYNATEEQLRLAIHNAIYKAEEILNCTISTQFRINHLKSYGFAYVWFTNEAVTNLLLGRNLDGTERIEFSLDETIDTKSWADINENYTKLPPIITLGDYALSSEQREELKAMAVSATAEQLNELDNLATIPFEVYPAYVYAIDKIYLSHTLHTKNIPPWLNNATLKRIFQPYASDPNKKFIKTIYKGNTRIKQECTYPHIEISNKGSVFINFDPATYDAAFCRLMVRKLSVKDKASDQSCTLIFEHAFA